MFYFFILLVFCNTEILHKDELQAFISKNKITKVINNAKNCDDIVVSWSAAQPLNAITLLKMDPPTIFVECNQLNIPLLVILAIMSTAFAVRTISAYSE